MSNNSDYLDRLRNIREKYGCSQPKNQAGVSQLHYTMNRNLGPEKLTGTHHRADLYAMQKTKISDHLTIPSATMLNSKHSDYNIRPQSSAGLSSQSYTGLGDLSRRAERQRQIQQIRQNYAASRKKVIDDFSNKTYTRQRQSSRQIPKDYLLSSDKDYLRQKDYLKQKDFARQRDYSKQFTRYKRDDYRETQIPLTATKIDLLGGYSGNQSVSPIKRMSQFEDRRNHRGGEAQDNFWRQRQARLSQMTSNRLNQTNRNLYSRQEKNLDSKHYPTKRSGMYTDTMKTYGNQAQGIARIDLQNKPMGGDYSVTNIDRIQQRIQSILGKK